MKRIRQRIKYAILPTTIALMALAALTTSTQVCAQVAAPQHSYSPIVKPPGAASDATGTSNPDPKSIRRPSKPTNDRMMHAPPASGANAK